MIYLDLDLDLDLGLVEVPNLEILNERKSY